MTCPSFHRSLYRELDKFYMREKDINYLAAILQVFSDSADPRFLLPSGSISRFCLISDPNMLAQNVQ